MRRVLVTGANGFVGRVLCGALSRANYFVRGAVRENNCQEKSMKETFKSIQVNEMIEIGDIANIETEYNLQKALKDIDVVVHLAARVHVMQERSADPLAAFRSVNVQGTEKLARFATQFGVSRFVYISSISVHGNSTDKGPYIEEDEPHPHSPYAVSKWEAELALKRVSRETGLDLVIVRPPLVYGPGVGGNFLMLIKWVDRCLPVPFRKINNLRSFIGIENLVDLIVRCVSYPQIAGGTFLVADGEDLSTPDLIRRMAKLLRRPVRLLPFPVGVMRFVARSMGKEDMLDRLCNCLQVDAGKARRKLCWSPRVSLDEGLEQTARWYLDVHKKA